jgi:hypothetical protein
LINPEKKKDSGAFAFARLSSLALSRKAAVTSAMTVPVFEFSPLPLSFGTITATTKRRI